MSAAAGEVAPRHASRPTALELSEGFAAGRTTPVQATEAALAAIERHDPAVRAMVLVDAEGALRAAEESTARWRAGEQRGPADGIPTTIKDILLTRGWPTLRGSLLIDAGEPQDWREDSPSVARLRAAGCVLLGKNATPEFAWKGVTDSLRHGATGNPWDPGLTAGGSSGGAAAAVGLGMGAWTVGTDGGGSVRIPAAFTGTVALKPTYGRVPLYPASPYGTLAHAGPMTTSVADAALLLDLIGVPDPRDWSALPAPVGLFLDGLDAGVAGLRVALSPRLGLDVENHPAADRAVREAADVLAGAGARVEEVDPQIADLDTLGAFHTLWFTGADKVVFDLLRAWSDGILVGAQTVRTEGYGPARTADDWLSMRAGRARHPTMVVVTGSGRLPETFLEEAAEGSDPAHAGTLEATPQGGAAEREAAGDVLVVTAGACPADRLADLRARLGRDRVLALAGERVDVAIALDALAERGLARVLAEGGPHLLADLVEADVVDEWCHTIVSRVVGGDAPRIVNTGGSVTLGLRLRPRLLLEAGGDLIGTWVRPTPHTAIGE